MIQHLPFQLTVFFDSPVMLLLPLVSLAGASSNSIIVGDGQVRVTALSSTVVRIEPKGPMGFEDR